MASTVEYSMALALLKRETFCFATSPALAARLRREGRIPPHASTERCSGDRVVVTGGGLPRHGVSVAPRACPKVTSSKISAAKRAAPKPRNESTKKETIPMTISLKKLLREDVDVTSRALALGPEATDVLKETLAFMKKQLEALQNLDEGDLPEDDKEDLQNVIAAVEGLVKMLQAEVGRRKQKDDQGRRLGEDDAGSKAIARAFGSKQKGEGFVHRGATLTLGMMTPAEAKAWLEKRG